MAKLGWSVSLGDAEGSGLAASGTIAADAVLTGGVTLDAGTNQALTLQLEDVARVVAILVTASRYDGSISVKGADAADPTLKLTGPLLAFGDAAARLAASLETLTVAVAAAPAQPASVSILIATDLT